MTTYSAEKLTRSQIALLHAFESNQSAVMDRITEVIETIRDQQLIMASQLASLTAMVGGLSRQIDQQHERQEQLERQLIERVA